MDTSLRVILSLLGFMVIAGIIWDFRSNSQKEQKRKEKEQFEHRRARLDLDELPFDETILLRDEPAFPASFAASAPKDQALARDKLEQPTIKASFKKEDFLVMHVMAKQGFFLGGKLLDAFNAVYLYYGERQIFYRYENIDGTGKEMFSVVSAVEPGYFEISKMEHFKTPGITLFFMLTRPNRSIAAFEMMLRTAKQLAIHLDGTLLNEQHRPLTTETVEHYRYRIRSLQTQTPVFSAS